MILFLINSFCLTVTVTYIKDGESKIALYNMEEYTNNSIGK